MKSLTQKRQGGKGGNESLVCLLCDLGALAPLRETVSWFFRTKHVVLLVAQLIAASLALSACHKKTAVVGSDPLLRAYDTEQDWNDPQRTIPLNYQQAQGKRVFYSNCVWCHADATPAGPSNRSNLTPNPPLFNDGTTLNDISDEFMQNIVTLGGSALGKSAMMPPWGQTLTQDEVRAVIAYARVIAQPPYKPPARPGPPYSVK